MHADVFVDTNGFIHFRDLKDCPWKQLIDGVSTVDIVVASSVIRELDHHKNSTNDRRRNRARLALRVIEQASRSPDFALELKLLPVRIRMVISTQVVDWKQTPNLDPAKPDDQLVAEARSYSARSIVLSNDAGPRIRARTIGLRAEEPPDDWLLPLQKTDAQRKLEQAEADLKSLRSTIPQISLNLADQESIGQEANFEIPILRALTAEEVLKCTTRLGANERAAERRRTGSIYATPLGPTDINDYNHDVRRYFEVLHTETMQQERVGYVDFVLENTGTVVTHNLRVEVTVTGAHLIEPTDERRGGELNPPRYPTGDYEYDLGYVSKYPIRFSEEEDVLEFRWVRRPTNNECAYQCQEFRPTQRRELREWLYAPKELPCAGKIEIKVSATNLPRPVQIELRFSMRERQTPWNSPEILKEIPAQVANVLREIGIE